jgi:hypothetical protein
MKEFLEPYMIVSIAIIIGSFSAATTLFIVLRDRLSGVRVSRTGVEVRTNDVPAWSKIVDTIERIDANTAKAIRKATARLMILDPKKYNMSAEAMLVIREANLPLIYAAYENHHTRELESDADAYLADKAQDSLGCRADLESIFSRIDRCKIGCFRLPLAQNDIASEPSARVQRQSDLLCFAARTERHQQHRERDSCGMPEQKPGLYPTH